MIYLRPLYPQQAKTNSIQLECFHASPANCVHLVLSFSSCSDSSRNNPPDTTTFLARHMALRQAVTFKPVADVGRLQVSGCSSGSMNLGGQNGMHNTSFNFTCPLNRFIEFEEVVTTSHNVKPGCSKTATGMTQKEKLCKILQVVKIESNTTCWKDKTYCGTNTCDACLGVQSGHLNATNISACHRQIDAMVATLASKEQSSLIQNEIGQLPFSMQLCRHGSQYPATQWVSTKSLDDFNIGIQFGYPMVSLLNPGLARCLL